MFLSTFYFPFFKSKLKGHLDIFKVVLFLQFNSQICLMLAMCNNTFLILSQTTIFRLVKTERVANDNFKFDEMTERLSKQVKKTVGKGEIAH